MSSQRWIAVMAALVAGVCIGAGVAEAGVISPVGGVGNVRLTICKQNSPGVCTDVTDTYLPLWTPTASEPDRTVYVVVNGSATVPTFVAPGSPEPASSADPGRCTNFGDKAIPPAVEPADFKFNTLATVNFTSGGTTGTGYSLISEDCGGRAVLLIGNDRFVIPRDENGPGLTPNGIPDVLEGFGVALTPDGDPDGDGLSTYDEMVRGFIIGGQQKRLNPTVKNLLGFLVKGQCGTSLLTTGALPLPAGFDPGPLDANLRSLIPVPATVPSGIEATQVHFLGNSLSLGSDPAARTNEWVDHSIGFSLGSSGTTETWTYCNAALAPGATCSATDGTVVVTPASNPPAAPANDRVVNKNRRYGDVQKGIRWTECATTSGTAPQGTGRLGDITSGLDEAVIYTDRIRRFVNSAGTRSATIYYSTFVGADWTALQNIGSGTNARNFITFKGIQYILSTEAGHDLNLIADLTSATFPHYRAGTGDNMDEAMRAITSGTPSGVKFYIPSVFNNVGQSTIQLEPPVIIP